ncbi:DUF924 family protein [Methylibium sp.]|uniref:DUF924 family protein n=1 Tax=Methylibium sp. TaxID=2067992 RepID=UPI003D0FD40E
MNHIPDPPARRAARGAPTTPGAAEDVLRYWFGSDDAVRTEWFTRSAAFDAETDLRFGAEVEAALQGRLDLWRRTRDGSLALVILLDQCTRNLYRGTPRAFAGDPQALTMARELIAQGQHATLPPLRRWFLFMPLEHAEDRALQDQSVSLFTALAADAGPHAAALANALDYAERHRAVIARFGRFPHRNEVLGRESTAQELAFLKEPGSRF